MSLFNGGHFEIQDGHHNFGRITCVRQFFLYHLGDNCIQNFHLGRYTVGNLVLRRRISGAVKRDFRTYI